MYVCIIQEYNIKVNDFAIFFAKKRKNFAENAKYYVILSQNDMEKHENRRFAAVFCFLPCATADLFICDIVVFQ